MPSRNVHSRRAFTLVELILVMAVLCLIFGLAAPTLSRSMHQRTLTQESTRLLAVTEYARDEATSRGVPVVVWIDSNAGTYGVKAKEGYEDAGVREKDYTLTTNLKFDGVKVTKGAGGENDAVEFEADGTLDPSSQTSITIEDPSNNTMGITQTQDAWGYQLAGTQTP